MADIKCVITYPDNFITQIGEFEINYESAVETIKSSGVLHVTREDVDVSLFIDVVGMIFGPANLTCNMDVFIGDTKINEEPINGKYKDNSGGYLFNWTQR